MQKVLAIFHLTSCKESIGVDELFEECGKKYLELNKIVSNEQKGKGNIVLENDKDKDKNNPSNKKRKFC